MIKLYDSNITDILPEIFAYDPQVQALGYAINKAMQRLMDYCQNISIYAAIDTAPEQVLDLLAVELNTQYYDDTLNIDTKRALIKNTLIWYTNTGTPAAVTELVEAIFGSGEIEEWFEYGGDPYHFKIHTFNVAATDEMLRLAESLVGSVQNVRSHLEEVIIEIMESMNIYIGCKASIEDDVTVYASLSDVVIYLTDENDEQLTDENGELLYYLL